jgi:hypothetical protein
VAPYGRRVTPDGARLEPHPDELEARAVARELRARGCRCGWSRSSCTSAASGAGRAGGSLVQVKRMIA